VVCMILGLCEIVNVSKDCVFCVYLVCQKIAKGQKHIKTGCLMCFCKV